MKNEQQYHRHPPQEVRPPPPKHKDAQSQKSRAKKKASEPFFSSTCHLNKMKLGTIFIQDSFTHVGDNPSHIAQVKHTLRGALS